MRARTGSGNPTACPLIVPCPGAESGNHAATGFGKVLHKRADEGLVAWVAGYVGACAASNWRRGRSGEKAANLHSMQRFPR